MTTGDELIELLVKAAEAAYPVFSQRLADRPNADWLGGTTIITSPLLEQQAFIDCVSAADLYPGFGEVLAEPEIGQTFLYENGRGQHPTSTSHVVFNALTHAAVTALWSAEQFTLNRLTDSARVIGAELIAWAADKSSKLTALRVVGLYNAFLSPNAVIRTPWGIMVATPNRPSPPMAFRLGGAVFGGGYLAVSSSTGDGLPPRSYPSAMLVQTEKVTVDLAPGDQHRSRIAFEERIDKIVDSLGLAIVLAAGHYEHSAPIYGGSSGSQPILGGAGGFSNPLGSFQSMLTVPIPRTLEADVTKYAGLVSRANKAFLFAGRRLMSSFNASSSEDALVDAVVVWEVMFGASPETTFRVTGALAKTLGPEFEDDVPLIDFQKKLADIYAMRSAIVHGNAAKLDKEAKSVRDFALNAKRYSWRLMRAALQWDPIVQRADSHERSKWAMLDPSWPNPPESVKTRAEER